MGRWIIALRREEKDQEIQDGCDVCLQLELPSALAREGNERSMQYWRAVQATTYHLEVDKKSHHQVE